ncbi:ABC transporter ATP-binding protein [Aureimonas sp. AU40]|uniref:ABC transporter ATP-binding protein n=1 Tax=Aureimonas sp. AU40 TaxID=1637747 RepID=UPI000783BA62|nr:ATP-binding cassette domain-containing protein [Aureimonas sp. AU40]
MLDTLTPTPARKTKETRTQAGAGAGFSLKGVAFDVPGRRLLEDISLDLPAGRVVGLVGHNGSGKSTLLKLLARQEVPSAGHLAFGGRNLKTWGSRDFARAVAYLPQSTPAAPGMTVRELVALGRYPWHGPFGRFRETDRQKVAEALALTDTEAMGDRAVDALSGGERQRVWLAMLVAQDAECLLLDEPISALDIAHQIEILDLVRRLSHERGVGVIAVLHEVNMAARFCDEILALKGGRVVARGTPGEVVAAGPLRRIYGLDMAVIAHPGSGDPMAFPL